MVDQSPRALPPHVVIIGGGFGGLYAAIGLRRAPVQVTLIDRCNHHLFQPLLYQVATASLSPADIARPIRTILRSQKNARVLLAEVVSIDAENRTVRLADGELTYDTLVVATGATHSYFGHDEWAQWAHGLKEIDDALKIREKFVLSFEAAEREADPAARRAALTFIVIGGGPTGVEMAGAMAEIARRSMRGEFRRIDPGTARIILIEGADRLLGAYPESLSQRAKADLESLGVEVWVGTRVTGVDGDGVWLGNERIIARNIVWAAGVQGSPLGRNLADQLGIRVDRFGRVPVGPDLAVQAHPEIFVVGDLAQFHDPRSGATIPGIAPAAMQMGRYVARVIERECWARSVQGSSFIPPPRPPFAYSDKGMLATIGRARAVGMIGRARVTGFLAWLLWLVIHITYLIGFRNRVLVLIQWAWAYVRFERGARLITGRAAELLAAANVAARGAVERKPPVS